MSSPNHKPKSASLSDRPGTRLSPRRDYSNISEPVPPIQRTTTSPGIRHAYSEGPYLGQRGDQWSHLNVPTLTHSRSGSYLQTANLYNDRLSTGPSIGMSSISSMPSLKQDPKKPAGFKATIKRVFGSKRRRPLADDSHKAYHMSDPGNLTMSNHPPSSHSSSHKSSRPQTAMQKRALGSHAINPTSDICDFNIEREQQHSEQNTSPKRRNTLPSLVFSDDEAQTFTKRLGDLMGVDINQSMRNDSTISTKRRLKSVEGLSGHYKPEVRGPSNRQDRESEIAFWKNSILLNPLPKVNRNITNDASTNDLEDNIKEMPSLEQIITPNQNFDFGLQNSGNQSNDLEERVNTLEVKMFDFEYAIAKLQGVELAKPPLPMKKVKRKNVQEIFSKPSLQSLSTTTSGYEQPPLTPRDSPILPPIWKEPFMGDRNSKATTIRPLRRSISQPRSSLHLTRDQFDSLITMIQDEKNARQLMELQIIDLQKEIELLHTPVYATINYPTPSPESARVAPKQKKLHRSPHFHFSKPPMREASRFSLTESDNDSADNGFEERFETPRQDAYEFGSSKRSPLIGVVS